jgi:phosphoribosylaminoimidazolecarboxamide formyltransferase/IMP cyclohydrolase
MLVLPTRKVRDLRYGENPHQRAAFYTTVPTTEEIGLRTLATARQLHGRELSLNNLLDLDAAWTTVRDFRGPTCVIIKHTNPCGLASRATLVEAYEAAHSGDPVAAYDGTVAVNGTVDAETAEAISAVSYSVAPYQAVVAPEFAPEALDILERRPNLCLIAMGERSSPRKGEFTWLPDHRLDFKRVAGGFAVQHRSVLRDEDIALRVVSKRQPTFAEITDLKFAWKAVKHVKSNAIVLAKQLTVVGVGAGQMKRIDAVDLAIRHAGDRTAGSVLASDAYFPFADGVERAVAAGVTAIIQPGGSIRDDEVIRAADSQGVAMVFTGTRQFKH